MSFFSRITAAITECERVTLLCEKGRSSTSVHRIVRRPFSSGETLTMLIGVETYCRQCELDQQFRLQIFARKKAFGGRVRPWQSIYSLSVVRPIGEVRCVIDCTAACTIGCSKIHGLMGAANLLANYAITAEDGAQLIRVPRPSAQPERQPSDLPLEMIRRK
ncbi:MAG: hypothetical protein R3C53_27935 [Pirellulaceae bacterium]